MFMALLTTREAETAQKFQTCTQVASEGRFRRIFQAMHPRVGEFGTVRWPKRGSLKLLLTA